MNSLTPIPKPDKTLCVTCGQAESPNRKLQRCGKCRTSPYCSVECQKADWKSHKPLCVKYAMDNSFSYPGVYINEKTPKPKKGEIRRTRGEIFQDLNAFANSHNGDTLTLSAWMLLDLLKDISRARTHFLAVTLRRTTSSNPRLFYSLVEAEVLPWSALETVYENRVNYGDSSQVSPRKMFKADEERRKRLHGALGSVMVVSIELPAGDNRPPRNALGEVAIHILQPLGLFTEHKISLSRFPPTPRDWWTRSLANGLKGGAFSAVFVPYTPKDD